MPLMHDGDHVVFTGYLTKFFNPLFENLTFCESGKESHFLTKTIEFEWENLLYPYMKELFFQMFLF